MKLFEFKKNDVDKAVEPDVADITTYWDQLKGLVLDQTQEPRLQSQTHWTHIKWCDWN